MTRRDAVVVGSGPNGLAAAILLAHHGLDVLVVEANEVPGGGVRSDFLTLPGFLHDVCSAVYPMAVGSPFFSSLPLHEHGLEWIHAPLPLAHPLEGDLAAALHRDPRETAAALASDGEAWLGLLGSLSDDWHAFAADVLGPLLRWPIPRGGAGRLAEALVDHLRSLGGEIVTDWRVETLEELPPSRAVLLDLTPRQVIAVARRRLPDRYLRRLGRYRYGPGALKVDWALDGPVPWSAPACGRAATVHLGGSLSEIEAAERAPWEGRFPERPFVLFAEPSRFDASRAPAGKGTGWGYCHVPSGWAGDLDEAADRIEAQVERFAPGFRGRVLARSVRGPAELEAANPNLVGGDINGGVQDLAQLVARPVLSRDPYATPTPGLYLCSASTPPGGGVHGMCGYHAARSALRRTFGR